MTLAALLLADDDNGASGTIGLVVFLVLLVGCILLFRSMNGRIKRLPSTFDPPPLVPAQSDQGGPTDVSPAPAPDAAGPP